MRIKMPIEGSKLVESGLKNASCMVALIHNMHELHAVRRTRWSSQVVSSPLQ